MVADLPLPLIGEAENSSHPQIVTTMALGVISEYGHHTGEVSASAYNKM